jgi:hypothetical protein
MAVYWDWNFRKQSENTGTISQANPKASGGEFT